MPPLVLLIPLLCAEPSVLADVLEEMKVAPADRIAIEAQVNDAAQATARRLTQKSGMKPSVIEGLIRDNVTENLIEKLALGEPAGTFVLGADEIRRTVVEYEAFKLEAFARSGVFPKRYFGYFDNKWDTAAYEERLRKTIRAGVDIANQALKERKKQFEVADIEIAITFIAEGGAILLRENQKDLERIHPVFGVGLDDITTGFEKEAELVARLDRALKTDLAGLVDRRGARPTLARYMRFEEAVLGTLVMYVFEKDLAEKKLKAEKRQSLGQLPLDEQFIISSLVYNSGLLFGADRIAAIRDFDTGEYLRRVSAANATKRDLLPVFGAGEGIALTIELGRYPWQPTSWSAVYHVLQRYGAFVAMRRFTGVFDASGRFKD